MPVVKKKKEKKKNAIFLLLIPLNNYAFFTVFIHLMVLFSEIVETVSKKLLKS